MEQDSFCVDEFLAPLQAFSHKYHEFRARILQILIALILSDYQVVQKFNCFAF